MKVVKSIGAVIAGFRIHENTPTLIFHIAGKIRKEVARDCEKRLATKNTKTKESK